MFSLSRGGRAFITEGRLSKKASLCEKYLNVLGKMGRAATFT